MFPLDKIFDHIAIYDFWGIFGAGAVTGMSATVALHYDSSKFIHLDNDMQLLSIFIAIIIFYTIGLILHSIASLLVELPIFHFKTGNITQTDESEIFKFRWKKKYVLENKCIKQDTLELGFQNCYNYLKMRNLTKRADKYHSIYGMARSLSVGYFLILINMLFSDIANYDFKKIAICAILIMLFYVRTKKYFYRWVESIFIQYQFEIEKESKIK